MTDLLSMDCFETNEVPVETTLINPIEYIHNNYPYIITTHMIFDPNVVSEYKIIRQQSHDGTLLFTLDMINTVLVDLIRGFSCYKPTIPKDQSTIKQINYTVGNIEIKTAYGRVEVGCGIVSGQRELLTLPVKCEYVLKDE